MKKTNSKIKKIISLLLVCATMLTMGIFNVSAQWGDYGDFGYFIEDGEVVITTLSENVSGAVTIPNTIEGYPVTSVVAFNINMRPITSIEVESDNAYFTSKDGILYSKDMKKLILVPSGKNVTSFVVPDGVTSIDGAFAFCTSLKEITIPDSETYMNYFTFAECHELKDIYYGGTESQWEEIMGEYYPDGIPAFDDYIYQATVHYNSTGTNTDTTVNVTGVSLNKTTTTLQVGKTTTLTATVTPNNATNKDVIWTSSNDAVATVENGVVTAKSAGTATITVTTEDGQKTATCVVTVKEQSSGGSGSSGGGGGYVPSEPKKEQEVTATKKSGWEKVDNTWYYYNTNGEAVKGWLKDTDGKWYYMNSSGAMATGWVKDGNAWYYLNSSGAMLTGWVKDGNTWYYLNSSGAMATGWVKDGGAWYYLNSSGAMATGWVKDGNTWYYMNSSGAMATGWVKDGNAWYYMNSNGVMRTAPLTENGKTYYFNANGSMK